MIKNYLFALTLLFLLSGTSSAQTTSFTYQGKLTTSGTPASGNYDLQFRLFDAVSGGTQVGATLIFDGLGMNPPSVAVANGIFTVTLDFGACPSCFNGSARYLDIIVRPNGPGSYTPLTPRQAITSTPYAIKSQSLTVNGPYGDGTINFTASNIFAGENAGVGTTPDPILGNPFGKFNAFFGAGAGKVNTTGFENTFFGYRAGNSNTIGVGNTFLGSFAGFNITTGNQNTFIGDGAGVFGDSQSNNTLLGFNAKSNSGINNTTAIGAYAFATQSNSLVLGPITGVNGCSSPCSSINVGIGTTAPTERLRVVSNGLFTGNLTVNGTLSFAASSLTGVVATTNGGTGLSSSGGAGSYLRSNGTNWISSTLQAGDLTGTLGTTNGGTGLGTSGVAGSYLRSNGSAWTSAAIQPTDLPAGSANYIQNSPTFQSQATFYIASGRISGGVRIEGLGFIVPDTPSLSLASTGSVQVDAPFLPGGRFTILENGNVGIGNGVPTEKLHVAGNGMFTGNLTVNGRLTGTLADGTVNVEKLSSNASPNVGKLLGLLRWDMLKGSATFPAGARPEHIAFDGANIWVSSLSNSSVTKLRISDGAVLGTFPVGTNPIGIAFDGVNMWTANDGSNNVTRLPPAFP